MNIFDLNHLEAVEGTDVVGGRYYGGYRSNTFRTYIDKDVDIDIDENVDIDKDVNSKVKLKGNLALAEGDAQAKGFNTLAESFTFTYTDPYNSAASSTSVSASD